MTPLLKAPFPYFGGKSTVAHLVWRALGDVKFYIEPFFGSGAVLLRRSEYLNTKHIETVNDADGHICNVWRAIQFNPDEVSKWCDWPVSHLDLNARRRKLNAEYDELVRKLGQDDEYYNTKLAGYWIWAASCWIGSGLTCINARPCIYSSGKGVHAIGQIPHISHQGMGIHAMSTRINNPDEIQDISNPYNNNIYHWFRLLSERLRNVRTVCGDWTRVCGGNSQDAKGTVGIFFDPPYSDKAGRSKNIYAVDSQSVAHNVRKWCVERGDRPHYRIVLAGYYEEHEELLDHGWNVHRWKSHGGYGNHSGNKNGQREALFMSPHCLVENNQMELL